MTTTAGMQRDLHLDKAIDVTTIPQIETGVTPKVDKHEDAEVTTYLESEFFSVYRWEVNGKATFTFNERYLLVSVIKCEGALLHAGEHYLLKKGMHFILPVGFGEFGLEGNAELIVSYT